MPIPIETRQLAYDMASNIQVKKNEIRTLEYNLAIMQRTMLMNKSNITFEEIRNFNERISQLKGG